MTEQGCKWRRKEVQSAGLSVVTALTDTLWIFDGRHHVLSNQGRKIPSAFSKFVGYNNPELHKHRKRQVGNMSGSVLDSMSKHCFIACKQVTGKEMNGWK